MNKLFTLTTLLFASVAWHSFAGEQIDKQMSADGATSISIENQSGQVFVTGWQKDEITVTGELDDDAERLIFERDGTQVKLKVVLPRHRKSKWHNKGSILHINVPSSLTVDVAGVSSDVELAKLTKRIDAKTVSGDIRANALSEYVSLSTVSGTINSNALSGKVSLSTVSGDIKDKQSKGRLKLKAVSGDISTQSTATEVSMTSVSGEIAFALGSLDVLDLSTVSGEAKGNLSLNDSGLVKMNSVSGDITLTFDNDVQASFNMHSNAGGELINNITDEKAQHAKYGPSVKLAFTTGNGSGSVKAKTVSGQIKVSQR